MKDAWIWLSHVTSDSTPAYGGGSAFKATAEKQICRGDSCNTVAISMSNHIGSHVDAPRHFIADEKTVTEYAPLDWHFKAPLLISLDTGEGQILGPEDIDSIIPENVTDADLVLMRTCSHLDRKARDYYKLQPGFSPELCHYFSQKFTSFNAIGLDALSISSIRHRELGREAHREFLGEGKRIFEDLALSSIPPDSSLKQVVALPFRFENADGSPVTVIGEIAHSSSIRA